MNGHTPPRKAVAGESLALVKAFKVLKHPVILILWIVTLLDSFVHNTYFFHTEPFLASPTVGIASNWTQAVMSVGQVAEILTMLILGATLKKLGWKVTMLVGIVLTGALLVHTRLAERQLEIDDLERAVRQEQQEFDVLRAQRAELRSPTRLAVAAGALGMSAGLESQFVSVDPMLLAVTIARTGEMPAAHSDLLSDARLRPLDQFRVVKSLRSEAP